MPDPTELLKAKQFLQSHTLATLATIDPDTNTPQAALIFYWYDSMQHLYFATLEESRKVGNLAKNASLAVAIGGSNEATTMQLEGIAREVSDANQKAVILGKLREQITKSDAHMVLWPMLQLHPHAILILEMSISWFRFSSFADETFIVEGTSSDLVTTRETQPEAN